MLRGLSEESTLEQLKEKRARQKRKREWKRRHIKTLQDTRDRRRERRLKIHQDIDRWRVEWIEKDAADRQKEKERQEADKQRKLAASARNRERNNQLLVDKLLELRTIRRNKLKAQGHFFPEEGNEFYEQIRKLNQKDQEIIKQDEPAEEEVETVEPHEDDKWLHNDLDFDTYKYWCQANSSLESLRKVRRQWDYYLTDTNKNNDMMVPLTMVQPSPPSNWIWATVLEDLGFNFDCCHLQNEYFEYGDTAQEPEFDHDILYRSGVTQRGFETYTPRVMIYDLKGGFGSLKKYNKLFQDDSEAHQDTWGQKVETFKSLEYPKNQYQKQLDMMDEMLKRYNQGIETAQDTDMNLDDSVQVWSDFNGNYFHPKSLNQINQYQMGNSLQPFDTYTAGYNAYDENEKETDSFDENFRFFVEECDQLQGFQIMTSIDDGFGGFTRGFLENVRDEYPKTSILTYGISNSNLPASMKNSQKILLNTSMAASGLSEYSSLYVPIHLPTTADINQPWARHLTINPSLQYHTSAILASAIETASVAWRIKKRSTHLADMISSINWRGDTNIASLSICFPLEVGNDKEYKNVDQIMPKGNDEFKLLKNLTVGKAKIEDTIFGDSTVIRGIKEKGSRINRETCIENIFDCLRTTNMPSNMRITANTGVPLPVSFPKLFSPNYIKQNISNDDSSKSYAPALTQLSTGTQFFSYFEQYQQRLKGVNYRLFSDYEEGDRGQSIEDFAELKDWLIEKADNFRPN
ncbi:hypothetical protein NQZ79_g3049 [Umbelopsis isabellina]|nr:hypothetical protein NQZ79_g3049 [Umbelopsis isabellina]